MRIGCSILDIILTELGNFVRKFVDFLKNEAVGILWISEEREKESMVGING